MTAAQQTLADAKAAVNQAEKNLADGQIENDALENAPPVVIDNGNNGNNENNGQSGEHGNGAGIYLLDLRYVRE